MTADVPQDRRVTVPTLGSTHTVVVDGSRLFWALLHPCMKDFGTGLRTRTGYKVMRCFSAFRCSHGPVPVHVRPSFRSRSRPNPRQPGAVLATVKVAARRLRRWPAAN